MNKVVMKVNGRSHQFIVDADRVLFDLLREDLGLTGVKQSCDRQGNCGTCDVIVNGRRVRSCLTKVVKLNGAEVTTIEGLGTPSNPHPIQEAFVIAGAIQCGYCTPGMIIMTKVLLDRNPNPSTEEIKKALVGNLCRCTGYVRIIEAVKLAARFLRGEITPYQARPNPYGPKLGVSHPNASAMLKACGVAEFTSDIRLENALELAAVRSTEFHANIKSIDTSVAERMPGVVGVLTAKDIKGTNRIKVVVGDQPVLCEDKVFTLGDPIAVVAAASRKEALAAAEAVKVEYERLPAVMTVYEAMAEGAPQVHPEWPNLCYSQPQIRGDAKKAMEESAAVIESSFSTQLNHQAPLEPENSLAYLEGEGEDAQLVVIGRSIDIHKHMADIQTALGYENVRYEEAYSGGQFGIKTVITTEAIAAAAALHFRRAVRYIPSLAESMQLTTKRHAENLKVKMGADAAGKITSLIMDIIVENGAYHYNGSRVLNRGLHMLTGSYLFPNVDVMGRVVYTNNASGGSARGAGAPQPTFAIECAMDMLAEKVGMDPLRFRKLNSLKPGESTSTGYVYHQWPFPELCDALQPHYDRAKKEAAAFRDGPIKRGVGIASHAFAIGAPGDVARASVEVDPDDGITVYAAAADPGEGNEAMLSQITSHLCNIPLNKIRLVTRDTDHTAASGPAAASRITYMVGGAVVDAINQLKKAMVEAGANTYEGLKKAGKPTRYLGTKKVEGKNVYSLDPVTGQGTSFQSRVHALQMVELEVNTDTGDVRALKVTTAVDAGTLIHPQNLEGQLHGGIDQGIGFALREKYIHGQTKDWFTFRFPTIRTSCEMETIIRETPRSQGPLGATGIGEMTMTAIPPAVINAIHNACGVWMCDLPAEPAKIKAALAAKSCVATRVQEQIESRTAAMGER